jgi:hypothetical protein
VTTRDVKDDIPDGQVFLRDGDEITGLELSVAVESGDAIPNVTGDEIDFRLSDQIGTESDLHVTLTKSVTKAAAHACTIGALPTCTYSNGTAGVGATLTADANGALPAQDFRTMAADEYLLVNNQAAKLQNGLYKITDLGSAGTPWILTRSVAADQSADYTDGITVDVGAGVAHQGKRFWSFPQTVTVGTTDILWRSALQPDKRRTIDEDFGGFLVGSDIVVASGAAQMVPGSGFVASLLGTDAKVAQVGAAEVLNGVASLDTGSTSSGSTGVSFGNGVGGGFTFSSTESADYFARWRIPTPSTTATQEFRCLLGFIDSFALLGNFPLRGMYLLAPEDGTSGNYDAVCQDDGADRTLQAWTRVTTTLTVTSTTHGMATGDTCYFATGSDLTVLGAGATRIVTVTGANTFTVECNNTGGASGTITVRPCPRTVVDTGIPVTALGNRRLRIRYNGTTGNAFFYVDTAGSMGTAPVATISTNITDGAVLVGASITKSAGSTARQLYVDRIAAKHLEARTTMELLPT